MLNVLVVEDDPTTQLLCHEMLKELGHVSFVSPNGAHAWMALATNANSFDVVLTDYMMPEMDGSELIRKIRENKDFISTTIIIMSAVISTKEISHLLKTGATFFLPKPFSMDQLKEYLEYSVGRLGRVSSLRSACGTHPGAFPTRRWSGG